MSGGIALAGAEGQYQDEILGYTGAAHILNVRTGTSIRVLAPTDGDLSYQRFGTAVAASGTALLIGAPLHTTGGAAFLYDAQTGALITRFTPSDLTQNAGFAFSVALSGSTALIGCPGTGFDPIAFSGGSAYVFEAGSQTETHNLTPPDAESFDRFGDAVGLSETIAVIGSPFDDDMGNDSGSVYLFNTETGGFLQKLTASDGGARDAFGSAIAVSGSLALISTDAFGGANGVTGRNCAYLFDLSTGEELRRLEPADGVLEGFGHSVALDGSLAVVGRFQRDALVFDVTTGEQLATLVPLDDRSPTDDFADTVAIDDGTILVGSPGVQHGTLFFAGSVFTYSAAIPVRRQPRDAIIDRGEAAEFELVLTETESVAYQWRRDGVDLVDDAQISGAQSPTLTIATTTETDIGFYDCVHTSRFGPPTTSERAVLTVLAPPTPCLVDFNEDGILDLIDITIFVTEFTGGCG